MKKILILDDDVQFLKALKTALEQKNVKIITHTDSEEGLRLIAKELPHIVITDINMPKLDGATLVDMGPHIAKNIIYIYVTANPLNEIKAKFLKFKDNIYFFQKPVDETFLNKVAELLQRDNDPTLASKSSTSTKK